MGHVVAYAGERDFTGKVVGITDGDTVTVLVGRTTTKVRLAYIDAPEARQPFGNRAKQALSDLVFGKSIQAEVTGTDRNGRKIARVLCEGVDTNAEMVRLGMAWVYRNYTPKASPLYDIEREAREAKRGLWAEGTAIPPWEWRSRARASGRPSSNQ